MSASTKILAAIATVTLVAVASVSAGDWPHWRGPAWNGSAGETGLPIRWSPEKNIAWKAVMPGRSASTPIVIGDGMFAVQPPPAVGKAASIAWTYTGPNPDVCTPLYYTSRLPARQLQASITAAAGSLLIRTERTLYCVRAPGDDK